MNNTNKLAIVRKQFKETLGAKQDALSVFEGVMGDGNGNVQVPDVGFENYSYVRINDVVQPVFNTRMPQQEGLRVTVGYDAGQPTLLQVLSTRTTTPFGETTRTVNYFAPSSYYSIYGTDPLWVDKRLWLPRRISTLAADDPLYTAFSVQMYPDYLFTGTGWVELALTVTDLESYIPATASMAVLVLITLDATGATVLTPGSEVTYGEIAVTDIPTPPVGTVDALAAVVMYNGETTITDVPGSSDIWDLRFTFRW